MTSPSEVLMLQSILTSLLKKSGVAFGQLFLEAGLAFLTALETCRPELWISEALSVLSNKIHMPVHVPRASAV